MSLNFIVNKKLIPALLLTFVNVIGFSILLPILPFILERYGGSAITYGVLISIYPFFQFLAAPVLGVLSDRYGRRPLLLISQAGTLISWVIFGVAYFVPSDIKLVYSLPIIVILVSRIVDGITGGNNSIVSAYVSDVTKPEDRSKTYGLLGAMFGVGFIVGPAIGAFSYSYGDSLGIGYLLTLSVSFLVSFVTLIFIYFWLPESLEEKDRDKSIELNIIKEINIFARIAKYKSDNFVYNLLFVRVFSAIVFSAYTSVVILFLKDRYGLNPTNLGFVLFVLGLYSILNQTIVVRFLVKKYGDLKPFYSSRWLLIISLPLLFFAYNIWLYLLIAYFISLSVAVGMPTFKAILTSSVDRSKQGEITGIDESLLAIGNVVAPVLSGIMYQFIGTATFAIYAFVMLIVMVIYFRRIKS